DRLRLGAAGNARHRHRRAVHDRNSSAPVPAWRPPLTAWSHLGRPVAPSKPRLEPAGEGGTPAAVQTVGGTAISARRCGLHVVSSPATPPSQRAVRAWARSDGLALPPILCRMRL